MNVVNEIYPADPAAVVAGDVTFLALGQVEELWDEAAIAMYPQRSAMLRMSASPVR